MPIWWLWIAVYLLVIWLCLIAKCSLAILRQPIAKHMLAILATSYRLNRNDRVSSFYWTRGSKLCFLTCFSYFSCYFHILVFSQNRYLLIFCCAFLGCTGIQFLVPFLVPLALQASMSYMRPHVSGTELVCISKQDARGNLVVASLPVNFPLIRLLLKVSGANVHWTEHKSYLSFSPKSSNWHFLAWPRPSQATQYSLGMESPRDFQTHE
jgi:hypothetical protein